MATTPEPGEPATQIQSPRDSAIASPGWASSTCSVHSEDLEYWRLGNRLYGRGFPFPADDRAREDHDARHAVFKKALKDRSFCAPVRLEGADVLELYTRTGILAMEIADKNPACSVIGVDESQMPEAWVPPNLQFEVCNLEDNDDWTWRQRRFRFIIIRQHGVFVKDLPGLIRRCSEILEDGGWIEFQLLTLGHYSQSEQQAPMGKKSKIQDIHGYLSHGLAALGRQLDIHDKLPRILEENSFHNLEHRGFPVPLGRWPKDEELKDLGHLWLDVLYWELEALMLLPLSVGLKWDYHLIQLFLADLRNELTQCEGLKMLTEVHVVYAQKVCEGRTT
ncbi:uncharacterized protein PV06_11243 [Exophiala oligosperma]|uniref:Methyltransferase domain-containing protein n=1 Tax=Exophiala oligosperma TaxID=215243 RepID=A0A0D2CZW7_9EURO|nr:uncharacterized protein PV06_11243 [Exophiala oligosperma]KIW36533.1 hypothetical protein PV06_11243 [Exophiala oligosperma]